VLAEIKGVAKALDEAIETAGEPSPRDTLQKRRSARIQLEHIRVALRRFEKIYGLRGEP